jgi:hypothetical protein
MNHTMFLPLEFHVSIFDFANQSGLAIENVFGENFQLFVKYGDNYV